MLGVGQIGLCAVAELPKVAVGPARSVEEAYGQRQTAFLLFFQIEGRYGRGVGQHIGESRGIATAGLVGHYQRDRISARILEYMVRVLLHRSIAVAEIPEVVGAALRGVRKWDVQGRAAVGIVQIKVGDGRLLYGDLLGHGLAAARLRGVARQGHRVGSGLIEQIAWIGQRRRIAGAEYPLAAPQVRGGVGQLYFLVGAEDLGRFERHLRRRQGRDRDRFGIRPAAVIGSEGHVVGAGLLEGVDRIVDRHHISVAEVPTDEGAEGGEVLERYGKGRTAFGTTGIEKGGHLLGLDDQLLGGGVGPAFVAGDQHDVVDGQAGIDRVFLNSRQGVGRGLPVAEIPEEVVRAADRHIVESDQHRRATGIQGDPEIGHRQRMYGDGVGVETGSAVVRQLQADQIGRIHQARRIEDGTTGLSLRGSLPVSEIPEVLGLKAGAEVGKVNE